MFKASEHRASDLLPEAVRFIATSEHVASQLDADAQLEWSPAVIGLCKAVEAEVYSLILLPLAEITGRDDLSEDRADKDIRGMAAFCADPSRRPPELGAFAHFLQTAIHSQQRRTTSVLLQGFLQLASNWVGSNWLLDANGFHLALTKLTTDFRNRAAHIDELGKPDYMDCRDLVIGTEGILWRLVLATRRHK